MKRIPRRNVAPQDCQLVGRTLRLMPETWQKVEAAAGKIPVGLYLRNWIEESLDATRKVA